MCKRSIGIMLMIIGMIAACGKSVQEQVFTGFLQPQGFPELVYHFETNPLTANGFALGKKLFYDARLSGDNSVSCGSCHIQTSAFTHHGHTLSHGVADRVGTRNSPPIMNLAWSKTFMWDGGIFDLDLQSIAPITNHVEMDETMANVLQKLQATPEYPALFKKAFGSEQITTANFLKAISQFMLMCVSSNSKYDSVMRKQTVFSVEEAKGYNLFKSKCNSCHTEPLFTNQSFANNGLSISSINDEGRYLITQQDTDRYKFKIPSLRNLAFTGPYMHDGRFLELDAVLDHYQAQVQATPNLAPQLKSGISLSPEEKKLLKAFLNTLNDRSFIFNPLLSEP